MMKERKVTEAPVDAERVVHELLDALETLAKKRAPRTSSLAGEQIKKKKKKTRGGRWNSTKESNRFDGEGSRSRRV